MTTPEYTLDSIAETVLPEDQAWEASVMLASHLADYLNTDGIKENSRYYWLDDAQSELCGVSEQPDLGGEVEIVLHRGQGTWHLGHPQNYTEIINMPKRAGQYIGFHVGHTATLATLLQVALPLNEGTSKLMRQGSTASFTYTPPQQSMMERYNTGDTMLNPRRVQIAAQITRRIISEQLVGRPSRFRTDEAEEAFLDIHFPYQDVGITGGGGKTVRMRAARRR